MTAATALDAPLSAPPAGSRRRWRLRPMLAVTRSWLGSTIFLVLLQLASLGLVIAWYVHVPFGVDAHTVAASYSIRLSHAKLYSDWGIAMIFIMPVAMQFALVGMCVTSRRASRVCLGIMCAVYVILVAVGHGLGAIETPTRRVNEAVFAGEFNRFYCSSRAMRVCLDGDEQSMLTLVGRGSASSAVLRESETVTDAAFSTWSRCAEIFVGNTSEYARNPEQPAGSYSILAGVANKLLGACAGSLETDAWCGTAWLAGTALTAEAHLAHPAPYANNARLFAAFTGEWGTRMEETNKLFGAAVGCLLLAMWCWGLREDSRY